MVDETTVAESTEAAAEDAEGSEAVVQKPDEVGVLKRTLSALRNKLTRTETKNARLAETLEQTVNKIADLEGRVTNTQKGDALTNLKTLKRQALEAQDWDKVMEIDDKIAEVQRIPVQAKKVAVPKDDPDPLIDDDDVSEFDAWQAEKDKSGELVRPWAKKGHPKYAKAAQIGAAVWADDEFPTTKEKLAEIDRLMTPKGQAVRNAPSVLSGREGPSGKAKEAGAKLSDEEKKIAHRFFDKEQPKKAEEMWAAAKAKSLSKKNSYGAAGHA